MAVPELKVPPNFIRHIVADDVKAGKNGGRVMTRFPPEPNGYLHIGHAKSICLNFGLAAEFGGLCNFRFDDTNPAKEDIEYVESIMADVRWLGFDWDNRLYHASDYFDQLYKWAVDLIKAGKAYVCSLTADQIREYRGTLTRPGVDSPYRNRPVAENLDCSSACARKARGRDARASGKNRYGLAQPQHAGPGHVPHKEGDAPPDRGQVGDLSDVRLRARPVRRDRGGSRTRSAQSSTKTTGRSTTGSSTRSKTFRATRSRSSSPG